MTATPSLPDPTRLDPIRAGSTDVRGLDMTGDLAPLNDSIQSVQSVSVIGRDDGATMEAGELMVLTVPNPPQVDPTGNIVTFWLTSDSSVYVNGTTVDYHIQVSVATSGGRTIITDAMAMVMPERG